MTRRAAALGLVAVTAVWGTSFTVVKAALADASPMVLVAVRFALAILLLAPALRGLTRDELRAGALLGLLFWAGFVFQTAGLESTTPARSAFITGLSTPLVPLVAWAAHRERPGMGVLVAMLAAGVGLYFLTSPGSTGLNRGDLLTLGCAVCFAGHIVAAGSLVRGRSAIRLLGVQLGLSGLLAAASSPLLESPRLRLTAGLAIAIGFLSLMAVTTFWFQLRAQQVVSPTDTALIFVLEPLFATLTSWLATGERLAPAQWGGAALIVASMVVPVLTTRELRRADHAPRLE